MDIGKLENNATFYNGFEDEPEVSLSITEEPNICIYVWDGYFEFIFGDPVLDGKGWQGFTRDYNQLERTLGNDDYEIKNPMEYLEDLLTYTAKNYEDENTKNCFELIRLFFEYAVASGKSVTVHVS